MRNSKLLCVLTLITFWNKASANTYNSNELFNNTLVDMRSTNLYEDLQSIMVKFVMHFEYNETMTVETGQGKKEIQRDDDILKFDDFLIYATVDSEYARKTLIDQSFDYDYPLNAFKLIRNNTIVLQRLANKMLSTFEHYMDKERADQMKAIKTVLENPPFPSKYDLEAVKQILIQLQDIYDLKSSEIAAAEILGDKSQWLSAEECIELADMAKQMGHSEKQISWLETAITRMTTNADRSFEISEVYSQLYDAYSSLGCKCTEESINIRNKLISLDLNNIKSYPNDCVEVTKETCHEKLAKVNRGLTKPQKDLESKFKHLCQRAANKVDLDGTATTGVVPDQMAPTGVDQDEMAPIGDVSFRSIQNKFITTRPLYCYHSQTSYPYYYINPFKIEILNLQPRMEVIHDFLRESETNLLIHHGKTNILADFKAKKTMPTLKHEIRTTSTTLRSNKQKKLVTKIQQRIATVTNSDSQSFGQFYLTNYGIGGYDELTNNKVNENEKISKVSVTLFLSDVIKGGEVVFPNLGISVKPVDKMALVVYGTGSDITGSDITVHGACPVVKGNKWIAIMDV